MRVAYVHTGRAFLPEIPAYCAALEASGHEAFVISHVGELAQGDRADIVVRFGGLLRPLKGLCMPEVHEYHSASTQWPRPLRNVAKSALSTRPVGRIFQNPFVRRQFFFPDRARFIYRDMGASPLMLTARKATSKSFDVVYAGSFKGRHGLVASLTAIARAGASVGVAGDPVPEDLCELRSAPGVEFVGRLAQSDVPGFLEEGRFGLNYVPDIYPLNRQTSTKVIEYLVAGLPIISNSYAWIDAHAGDMGYQYLKVQEAVDLANMEPPSRSVLPLERVQALLWPELLDKCQFVEFLEGCAGRFTDRIEGPPDCRPIQSSS